MRHNVLNTSAGLVLIMGTLVGCSRNTVSLAEINAWKQEVAQQNAEIQERTEKLEAQIKRVARDARTVQHQSQQNGLENFNDRLDQLEQETENATTISMFHSLWLTADMQDYRDYMYAFGGDAQEIETYVNTAVSTAGKVRKSEPQPLNPQNPQVINRQQQAVKEAADRAASVFKE